MHQTRIHQIDCTTGEVMEGVNVFLPTRHKLKGDFMLMSLEGLGMLATDKEILGTDWRVLAILMKRLDYENWIYVTQQEIANELGTKKQNVSVAIQKLVRKSIILKGEKKGNVNCYRLNTYYGWRGRINKEYQSTYEEHSKLIQFPQLPPSG